jgi:hypothetical protein
MSSRIVPLPKRGRCTTLVRYWAGAFFMSEIFISYARSDRALAEALAQDLTARGYSVWWDAELLGSDDFYEVILEALRQAKAAIVIWTKESAKSRFVRDEARFALHLEKLVAVKAPELDVYDIPFGFQGQHTDDIFSRDRIVRAIDKLGVRPVAPVPASVAASSPAWDRIKTAGTIDDIIVFLGTNPPDNERHAALARLKQLAAEPRSVAKGGSRAAPPLTKSNWQAFLSGLTFRVPKFQLSAQGTWTSIGATLAYGIVAVGASIWINDFLQSHISDRGTWLAIWACILTIMTIFLHRRVGAFLRQRIFIAAIILSFAFLFLATFAATATIISVARLAKVYNEGQFGPIFLVALLFFAVLSVWRIRAYR